MPDRDEELSAALREYYRRVEQQPAPDVTGRVLMSVDTRASRMRRWSVIGGGLVAAAAVAVVVVVALANHNQPAVPSAGHSATAAPTLSPTPTAGLPTAPVTEPVAVGLAVRGFVPTDVTAVSADEWWVLGYDGPSCTAASCTRIVHTSDGGHTFGSIPAPPVAPASNSQQATRLRFADPLNGWVVSGAGAVWETHDGGAQWASDSGAGSVVDLEASGRAVYAIQCVPDQTCVVEQSPTNGQDSWSTLSHSGGYGHLSHLNVHGTYIWAAIESPGGAPGLLLASADDGRSFSQHTVCPSALGSANLYAASSSVLWATCATGMQASAFRSVDGGQHFTQLSGTMSLPNFASIAGPSSTIAVIAGIGLQRTVDGGQTFATVKGDQLQATIVGFTTPVNGFEFTYQGARPGRTFLYRTDDAGAHWSQVQFP